MGAGVRIACVVCALTLMTHTTADIKAGSVTLKPSGVLSMLAEWEDTPKDGAKYDIFILTTLYSTEGVKVHRLNNLEFSTAKMSYNIPSGVQNQFIAGNTQTTGTFPGFVLNNAYQVYIRYVNGSNFQLNKPGGTVEQSSKASPMVQASPPLNVRACAASDRTSPCNRFVSLAFSLKIRWDWQASVGYGTYFPPNAYGLEYYIIELSDDVNFVNSVNTIMCRMGQADTTCHFGYLIAHFQNLSVASTYYYRVRGGTVIGQGQNSSTGVISLCNVETTPNAPNDPVCFLNYSSGCNAGYDYMNGCSACPAGKYASIADTTCKSCWFGQYSGEAAAVYSLCPRGTYNDEIAATTCKSCGARFYGGIAGATFSAQCDLCPSGTYINEAEKQCTSCPVGTYATWPDTTICTSCGQGMYAGATGATALSQCVACPTGKYSNESTATCTGCPEGKYGSLVAPTSVLSACTACPAGTSSTAGSSSVSTCFACPAGTYSNEVVLTCTGCPEGKYGSLVAATSVENCTACGINFFSPAQSTSRDACVCNKNFTLTNYQ